MSVRYFYQCIPANERICSRCQHPILRNIAKTPDGRLWHYGCLNTAKDEHHQCPECYASFDGTEALVSEYETGQGDTFTMSVKFACPYCGAEVPKHNRFSEEENLEVL